MRIFVIVLAVIIAAIIIFIIYRVVIVKQQNKKLNTERLKRVKALHDKLQSNQILSETDIVPFAKNLLTRETAYNLLTEYNKTLLFPEEYVSIISGAESNLANWLEFPTELDACPDEIEHISRVTLASDEHNNPFHYEVFKYRVNEPHWAAEDGWLLGVVGPYFNDSQPYDFPHATFSRMSSKLETITPEEEAKWVHENIALKLITAQVNAAL